MWGWIVGGLAALGGVAYVATRSDGAANEQGRRSKGAGWYVLRFDRVGEGSDHPRAFDKLPDGRPARLKQYDGAFETKDEAEEVARKARDEGWKGKDSRAIVDYRGRAPW